MKYTDEDVIRLVPEVKSVAQLLNKLGLRVAGGNYANMKRKLQLLKVDTTHWTGQAWSKDQQLKDWAEYAHPKHFRHHLIRVRGHRCEGKCRRKTWCGLPIPLEIHHIDGDRTNNTDSNLLLCCCNCHALTDNWRNRKRGCGEIGSTRRT
jgi:hypothetical protein